VETKEMSIGLVRKDLSLHKYNNEEHVGLFGASQGAHHPKVVVTNPEKHKGDIHLAYTGIFSDGGKSVFYTKSTDNAKTWTAPKDITPNDHKGDHYTDLAAVGIAGLQEVFLVYGENYGADIKMIFSENGGNSWSSPKKVNTRAGVVPYIKICGQTKTLGVFFSMFLEKENNKFDLLYYNHTDNSYKPIPRPFIEIPIFSHTPMVECTGLSNADVKFIVTAASKNAIVFDDYNYDLPDME